MSNRTAAEVFPPGEFLRDELEARGWTQTDLAEILGRPLKAVSEILTAKRAVTPETAKGLGEAFGVDPQFWMNIETVYRLSLIKDTYRDIARRARLYEVVPVKDLIRRQWIQDATDIAGLEREISTFYGVDSVAEIVALQASTEDREFLRFNSNAPLLFAWFVRAKQLAQTVQVAKFRSEKFEELITELLALSASEQQQVGRAPKLLADFGIRFLVIEHLPRTRIDGAAFWLDKDSPVVALSLRLDRIDGFWFTLFHELGHIFYRDSEKIDNSIVGDHQKPTEALSESERRANEFALKHFLTNPLRDFLFAEDGPIYSKARVDQFASLIKTLPSDSVDPPQRRGRIKVSKGRAGRVEVRATVTEVATTDGWGYVPSHS